MLGAESAHRWQYWRTRWRFSLRQESRYKLVSEMVDGLDPEPVPEEMTTTSLYP